MTDHTRELNAITNAITALTDVIRASDGPPRDPRCDVRVQRPVAAPREDVRLAMLQSTVNEACLILGAKEGRLLVTLKALRRILEERGEDGVVLTAANAMVDMQEREAARAVDAAPAAAQRDDLAAAAQQRVPVPSARDGDEEWLRDPHAVTVRVDGKDCLGLLIAKVVGDDAWSDALPEWEQFQHERDLKARLRLLVRAPDQRLDPSFPMRVLWWGPTYREGIASLVVRDWKSFRYVPGKIIEVITGSFLAARPT